MHKAKGILIVIVGLGLLMQIGTTVAFADDRGHRADKGKSDNKAQVSTKSSSQSSASMSASAKVAAEAKAKAEADLKAKADAEAKAGASNSPAGNNGTIKIHAVGTAQSDHRNEPKVCDFYIDGFNFDSTSSGQWRIDGQGQTSGSNIRSGAWGPSDSAGNWRTQVIAPRLPDGHYKAAAWQLAPNNPPGGEKTKVFKVECGQTGGNGSDTTTTVNNLSAAISNATTVQGQLATQIIAAQTLLASLTLTVGQQAALTNAINAAITEQDTLVARIIAAEKARTDLSNAISSGNAAQIAAVSLAEQATANLHAAANEAAQANVNLTTTISGFVSTGSGQTNNTTTNNTTTNNTTTNNTTTNNTTTTTTTPIVFGVQTLPAVSGGETNRATQNASQMMQGLQGLQTLPSTSTGTQVPLAMLGGILMSVGAWLLRKPARRNDS